MPRYRRDELEMTAHQSMCCDKALLGRVKGLGLDEKSTPVSGGRISILVCEECGARHLEIDGNVYLLR